LRTCEDTSNLVQGPTYTFQNPKPHHNPSWGSISNILSQHHQLPQCAISHNTIPLSKPPHDHHTLDI
jgi:hypothetical protein